MVHEVASVKDVFKLILSFLSILLKMCWASENNLTAGVQKITLDTRCVHYRWHFLVSFLLKLYTKLSSSMNYRTRKFGPVGIKLPYT